VAEADPASLPARDAANAPARVAVIGVGNSLRHDDGAGLELAGSLRGRVDPAEIAVIEQEGEALGLLERWRDAAAVVIVDAVRSGAPAGTVHRIDATRQPLPADLRSSTSTHAVGLREAIELARAIGRLPARVLVFGVEGERFDAGSGLSDPVRAVLGALAEEVLQTARGLSA